MSPSDFLHLIDVCFVLQREINFSVNNIKFNISESEKESDLSDESDGEGSEEGGLGLEALQEDLIDVNVLNIHTILFQLIKLTQTVLYIEFFLFSI